MVEVILRAQAREHDLAPFRDWLMSFHQGNRVMVDVRDGIRWHQLEPVLRLLADGGVQDYAVGWPSPRG